MKYSFLCALVFVLANTQAYAEDATSAVRTAVEECHKWAESEQAYEFPPTWSQVVGAPDFSDEANTVTSVFLSSKYPMLIETYYIESLQRTGATHPDLILPATQRLCSVKWVNTSSGKYRWRLRPVEIGNVWSNLGVLPVEVVQQQFTQLLASHVDNPAYVEHPVNENSVPSGGLRIFSLCNNKYHLGYGIRPDGIGEGGDGRWSVSISVGRAAKLPTNPALASCPGS